MISPGYLHEIRTGDVNKRISLIVKKLLPLPHHAQEIIIQNDQLHIDLALHDSTQLLDGHLKTAIANDGNNSSFRSTEFSSYSRRQCKTHRTQSPRSDVTFGLIKFCISTSDHLVLANIGHNYSITIGKFIQEFYYLTHGQSFTCRI